MRGRTRQRKVVAALSGGVDSAVAAAILSEQGNILCGATLKLRDSEPGPAVPSPEAVDRARAVSQHLGIPFRLIEARQAFQTHVVDYFIAEYAAGRTPNPCVRCNRFVRFGALMERVFALGGDTLATGHYARIGETDGTFQLLRACDVAKDQSYFLHRLTQPQLAHTSFPLGRLTKDKVRALARHYDLPVAEQPESQDVCFLLEGDYRNFLADRASGILEPGPIRDTSGRLLGSHCGLAAYTIGQRKGLGVSASEPLYVLELRPEENTVIVGTAAELGRDECLVRCVHYISGKARQSPFRAQAKIRYRASFASVTVDPLENNQARVRFDHPQRDITPGQYLVLHEEDVVLGGGIICEAQDSVL